MRFVELLAVFGDSGMERGKFGPSVEMAESAVYSFCAEEPGGVVVSGDGGFSVPVRPLGNACRRQFIWAPTPLEVAPGRPVWERQRGREYLVFVDESFYAFFGFSDPGGNFCHAAVGVPADNYQALQHALEPAVHAYRRRVHRLSGHAPDEVKSTALRTLPLRFQIEFVRELARHLREQAGFVSGFYTPTSGFIMESVRTGLIDTAEEVPLDHQDLYDAAKQNSLAALGGPGQADLITRLMILPVAAIKFMLGSFGCCFRIRYDPRQGDEDRAVREAVGTCMNGVLNLNPAR